MARARSNGFGLMIVALLVGIATAPATGYAEETINLTLDRATVIRTPARTTTVVIGNPAIADVSIQKSGVMVLTAKSYGETNLLALDSEGQLVSESWLKVQASTRNTLVVQRGGETETYSCEPLCKPTVTLGDSEKYFGKTSGQSGIRNGLATPSSGK
ncbi:MAG: pilus assembly protein N-terminal domain-containing protein [Beijerinckiaceae bacterium]